MNPSIVLLCGMLAAPLTPAFAADAKPLYDKHCMRCHGINGEGNQKITSMMKVKIRRLGWLTDKKAVDLVALIRAPKEDQSGLRRRPGRSGEGHVRSRRSFRRAVIGRT